MQCHLVARSSIQLHSVAAFEKHTHRTKPHNAVHPLFTFHRAPELAEFIALSECDTLLYVARKRMCAFDI